MHCIFSGNFILEVCVHSTIADVLVIVFAMVNECIVCKAIFGVNAMMSGKFFEVNLHLEHLVQ